MTIAEIEYKIKLYKQKHPQDKQLQQQPDKHAEEKKQEIKTENFVSEVNKTIVDKVKEENKPIQHKSSKKKKPVNNEEVKAQKPENRIYMVVEDINEVNKEEEKEEILVEENLEENPQE